MQDVPGKVPEDAFPEMETMARIITSTSPVDIVVIAKQLMERRKHRKI